MMKSLHDELGIEYFYVEWREGLGLLGVVPTATPVVPTATPVVPTENPVIPTANPVVPTATPAEDVVRRKLPVIQDR